MTGLTLAALTWVVLLFLPFDWRGAVVRLLLPSAFEGSTMSVIVGRWLLFAVGFTATAWVVQRCLAERAVADRYLASALARQPFDGLMVTGIGSSAFALVLAVAAGTMTLETVVVLALVPLGLLAAPTGTVVPPTPIVPEPPLPFPAPVEPDTDAVHRVRLEGHFQRTPSDPASVAQAFAFGVVIPEALYKKYKGLPHTISSGESYVQFANASLADPPLGDLSSQVRQWVLDKAFDRLDEIHLVLRLSHCMRYAYDKDEHGGEYPKYVVETLVDQRGDCEDFAIFSAALLARLGHRSALVLMDTDTSGHAAIAVEAPCPVSGVSFPVRDLGIEMVLAEVTPGAATPSADHTFQWRLGQQPVADARNYRVFPLATPTPSA